MVFNQACLRRTLVLSYRFSASSISFLDLTLIPSPKAREAKLWYSIWILYKLVTFIFLSTTNSQRSAFLCHPSSLLSAIFHPSSFLPICHPSSLLSAIRHLSSVIFSSHPSSVISCSFHLPSVIRQLFFSHLSSSH